MTSTIDIRKAAAPQRPAGIGGGRLVSCHIKMGRTRVASIMLLLLAATLAHASTASPSLDGDVGSASTNYQKVVALPPAEGERHSALSALQKVVLTHSIGTAKNPANGNRDRVVYVRGPYKNHPVLFPVASGAAVVAGDGRLLGHLDPSVHAVSLNFGQLKIIAGKLHVLAFATRTAEVGGVTGWISYHALLPSHELSQSKWIIAINANNGPDGGDAPQSFQVACADPAAWGDGLLKIVPNVDEAVEQHESATDYVDRPTDKVCYLLLSLPRHGGVATDVLSHGNIFIPSAGVPRVDVPLYVPKWPTRAEQKKWDTREWPHVMQFVYGRVGNRYGWIASADLKTP